MFVARGSELSGHDIFWQDCGATSKGGVVEAFVCVYSSDGHVTMLVGGCVKLREWFAECVGCECFNLFITEVGGNGLPTFPV
jgi:hypothetical protein